MSLSTDDLVEIQQLYARYNTAIDTGDGKTFGECFIAEAHFDSGYSKIDGREGISAFADQTHSAMPGMRHNATNILLEGDSQTTPGTAKGSAFLIGYTTDGGYKVIITGRYVDELTQVGYLTRATFPVYGPNTLISTGYQGTLGAGFATSLGAKVGQPDKRVLSINGDGGFLYGHSADFQLLPFPAYRENGGRSGSGRTGRSRYRCAARASRAVPCGECPTGRLLFPLCHPGE